MFSFWLKAAIDREGRGNRQGGGAICYKEQERMCCDE